MARNVAEWIGKDDNARAPKRVRDRLLARHPACYLCSRPFVAGEKVEFDHIVALINGGENRETNLRPVHAKCHRTKTASDVAEKPGLLPNGRSIRALRTRRRWKAGRSRRRARLSNGRSERRKSCHYRPGRNLSEDQEYEAI